MLVAEPDSYLLSLICQPFGAHSSSLSAAGMDSKVGASAAEAASLAETTSKCDAVSLVSNVGTKEAETVENNANEPVKGEEGTKAGVRNVGLRQKTVHPSSETFDPKHPTIRREIIMMIAQYLEDEGYLSSMMVVNDEANLKQKDDRKWNATWQRIERFILAGDWAEVEKLCAEVEKGRPALRGNIKALMYSVYTQQYLELIHRQESQKAFTYLKKRLKPLQAIYASPEEFQDLCFLLTCTQVNEAKSFRDWTGVNSSREALSQKFQRILDSDSLGAARSLTTKKVPRGRLVQLLQQAVAYQIEFSRYQHQKTKASLTTNFTTILEDYTCFVVPNTRHLTFTGHTKAVKCLTYLGDGGERLATGSADKTVRLWGSESGKCEKVLHSHKAKIWDVASDSRGRMLASATADGVVNVWNLHREEIELEQAVTAHHGDVYGTEKISRQIKSQKKNGFREPQFLFLVYLAGKS